MDITLEQAGRVLDAAVRAAAGRAEAVAAAVVDTGGNLVALRRMDGSTLITIDTSIGKATRPSPSARTPPTSSPSRSPAGRSSASGPSRRARAPSCSSRAGWCCARAAWWSAPSASPARARRRWTTRSHASASKPSMRLRRESRGEGEPLARHGDGATTVGMRGRGDGWGEMSRAAPSAREGRRGAGGARLRLTAADLAALDALPAAIGARY